MVYDGTAVNGAEWSATQYGYTSVVDRVFSVPAGKTVGTFYEMQLQVKQSVGGMTGWNVRLDSLYEDQITIPAGYDETTRWTHGDYAFGDSGGPPQLDTLSTNLRAISDLVGLAGTVNIVQREPITSFSLPVLANYNRRVDHRTPLALAGLSAAQLAGRVWRQRRAAAYDLLDIRRVNVEQQDADR